MDYSDDICVNHFTPQQMIRMHKMWHVFRDPNRDGSSDDEDSFDLNDYLAGGAPVYNETSSNNPAAAKPVGSETKGDL